MCKFYINILRLIGIRKNYEIYFNKGLNCISGPTSTGKTSILEMIDYALGAKRHKAYIEIGNSCTDVELEFVLLNEQYKIRRRLFDFTLPVKVEQWDSEENKYKYLNTFDIDNPSNSNSLSAFFIDKLGLSNVKIGNQFLSFRDIFKYSYLKQTEIDTENIMGEKDWAKNNKRKATFEVIFNIYDDMLAELKASLKEKEAELKEAKLRLEGVEEFIDNTEIGGISQYRKQKRDLENIILGLNKELEEIKSGATYSNTHVEELRKSVLLDKQMLDRGRADECEQDEYIKKLQLLLNQYQNDINKCEMILLGYKEINKYEYIVCPNCLRPLSEHQDRTVCQICGKEMSDSISDLIKIKKDMQSYKRRFTELSKHIQYEEERKKTIQKDLKRLEKIIKEKEAELNHLTEGYVNAHLEKIESLNYEVGKANRQLEEMDFSLKMLEEHERLQNLLRGMEKDIEGIRKNISILKAERSDKSDVIKMVTTEFNQLLKKFEFPKLDYGYIDETSYLPYVRNRKYNELGSLGGVTLIVLAYYLSIMKAAISRKDSFYLMFLMIDSPRKNLGIDASQEEFRDEKIFNSIVNTFMEMDKDYKEKIQLIVVNNGYPDFLPREYIKVEFDAAGQKGLIDDIE